MKKGKVSAKIAGRYNATIETAQDIDRIKAESERLRNALQSIKTYCEGRRLIMRTFHQ